MKGYKAFDKGMVCRGKQYAEKTVFTEDSAELCKKGMHFCENPIDCLDYYPLVDEDGNVTEFAEVSAPDDKTETCGNKSATTELHIGAKIGIDRIVKASVDITKKKCETYKTKNFGDSSKLAASGYGSKLAASGYGSKLAASGDDSQLAASGNDSQLAASGNDSQLAASGKNCICAAIGKNSIAKASISSWIVLAEYGKNNKVICVKAVQVDGEKIKENTFYRLKCGKFVEVVE